MHTSMKAGTQTRDSDLLAIAAFSKLSGVGTIGGDDGRNTLMTTPVPTWDNGCQLMTLSEKLTTYSPSDREGAHDICGKPCQCERLKKRLSCRLTEERERMQGDMKATNIDIAEVYNKA